MVSFPPTASVALSVFNAGDYLQPQLDSIMAQTCTPQQVVIGDDGSTDDSRERVAAAVKESGERGLGIEWTVLPPGPVGLHANMDRIFEACTGDVIVVCDHDDICLPERVEQAVERFSQDQALTFVQFDAQLIDGSGTVTAPSMVRARGVDAAEWELLSSREALRLLIRRFMVAGATCAFTKKFLESTAVRPDEIPYDYWYALMAASSGGFLFDSRVAVQYRVHGTNTSGGVRRRTVGEKLSILRAPGGERNARLLRWARYLAGGSEALGPAAPEWAVSLLEGNLAFQKRRSRYPRNRVLRAPLVLREVVAGTHQRFGRGRKDVLLDLLQPLP